MPSYHLVDDSELTVAPLTAAERQWCEKLEKVLLACPKRLAMYTMGDSNLVVVDAAAADAGDIHDSKAYDGGFALASIESGCQIHATTA
jgi:hypothetical protein